MIRAKMLAIRFIYRVHVHVCVYCILWQLKYTKTRLFFVFCVFFELQFNYLTAPTANNHHLNVNLVHQQQKPFVSQGPPYSEHYCYETSGRLTHNNSSTPNSTMRSVKNYRKPHPPSTNINYNIMNMNTSTTTSSNSSYSATNPLTNNLNHSYNTNSTYKFNNSQNHPASVGNNVSQSNNLNHSNTSYHSKMVSGGSNNEHPSLLPPYSSSIINNNNNKNHNNSNLSRRSSQSSGSHEWMAHEKPNHSLSLCINRTNLKKSNNSSHHKNSSSSTSSSSSTNRRRNNNNDSHDGGDVAQFQSMRCRKHRNRNHFFNTSSSTSYQKYKLTKSCSNDTVNSNSNEQTDLTVNVEKNPQTTQKFI